MIDFSLLWRLCEPEVTSQLALALVEKRSWEDSIMIACGKMAVVTPPVYRFIRGRRPTAHLPAEIHDTIVSHQFTQALTAARCTGWATYPVTIEGLPETPLAPFYGLIVHGKAGRPDPALSAKATLLPPRPAGRPVAGRVGMYFHDWDGTDVFMPEGTTVVMLSDKAKQAVENLKVVKFTRADQYIQYDLMHEMTL